MERLLVHPKYQPTFTALGWNNFASIVAHFLSDSSRRGKVMVKPASIAMNGGEVTIFFKLYEHGADAWSFWLRASKARREFENYEIFARLNVPAAEPIACGEERDGLGRVRRAFIITRAVPDSCTLIDFFRSEPLGSERALVIRQLATLVRRLHDDHFYYHDLVWRNILVSRQSDSAPKIFLIDCPRGAFARLSCARKRLRDLASLDKSASQFCTRAERLRFLQLYSGEQTSSGELHALALASLNYRRTRWPEDWRGK